MKNTRCFQNGMPKDSRRLLLLQEILWGAIYESLVIGNGLPRIFDARNDIKLESTENEGRDCPSLQACMSF